MLSEAAEKCCSVSRSLIEYFRYLSHFQRRQSPGQGDKLNVFSNKNGNSEGRMHSDDKVSIILPPTHTPHPSPRPAFVSSLSAPKIPEGEKVDFDVSLAKQFSLAGRLFV